MKPDNEGYTDFPPHIARILVAVRPHLARGIRKNLLDYMRHLRNHNESNIRVVERLTVAEVQVRNLDRELVTARRRIAELESKGE